MFKTGFELRLCPTPGHAVQIIYDFLKVLGNYLMQSRSTLANCGLISFLLSSPLGSDLSLNE